MTPIKYILISILTFCTIAGNAQKVGIVLSGGGAKGIAHIGILKALEENDIPIDYITGTSMGGIVGAMYAAGYSPEEIEKVALSMDFQDWVGGRYQSDYNFFFQKKSLSPSILTAKLSVDTNLRMTFRSNLVNDIPLNFALLELFSQASAIAKDNFDNLFVPYRCMVSDIISQTSITVSKGSLAEAVRATMTVPLIYRPIKLEDKYVFDGGLYNNFPADVMKSSFKPDVIIGSNVSAKTFNEYPKNNDERLMSRLMIFMFLSKSDSTLIGENGIYIQPNLGEYSVSNFNPVAALIKEGYDATMAEMPQIKKKIARRVGKTEIILKRNAFNNKKPDLNFSGISVSGVNDQQKKYIERLFKRDSAKFNLNDIKRGYYKLVADETFETIYPKTTYNPATDTYNFEIIANPGKNFKVDFGGNISTRPISNVFLGLQYNYLNRKSYTFGANVYSGRFYESLQLGGRIDYPSGLPLFLAMEMTYNHFDYYNTSSIFIENPHPTYIEQADRKIDLKIGFPLNRNTKIMLSTAFINNSDKYSPDNTFSVGDELDKTIFNASRTTLVFEQYTFNRKQYASKGRNFLMSINYFAGRESYSPGNIYDALSKWQYAATAGLVYHTPVGPISFSYNLYDDPVKRNGVLLHLGYLIYNKRSIE